jgi:hypothetical protein
LRLWFFKRGKNFIDKLEQITGRTLRKRKPVRPKKRSGVRNKKYGKWVSCPQISRFLFFGGEHAEY